jgi:segregation and condensation protein B
MHDGPDERLVMLEALLFAAEGVQPANRLIQFLGKSARKDLPNLVQHLNESYASDGRAFRIREIAGGYQMYLMPTYTRAVEKFLKKQRERRLSQAALETLAIVAYKQPVTRADIEHIRGVNSDGVIASLLERKLTAIVGRSQKVGRALLYGTTKQFLEYFGLKSLDELPRLDELVLPGEDSSPLDQVELELEPSGKEIESEESVGAGGADGDTILAVAGQEIDGNPDVNK